MRHFKLLLISCVLFACSKRDSSEPRFDPKKVEHSAAEGAAPITNTDAGIGSAPSTIDAGADAGGEWVEFVRTSDVPLCVLSEYDDYDKAPFLANVPKTVKTRADNRLVFGAYAPGCASTDCVRDPTLQCWADVDSDAGTIKVESRYIGWQKAGASCTKHCEPVHAACETATNLSAGTYTVLYGSQKTKLKIPGVLKPACIRSE